MRKRSWSHSKLEVFKFEFNICVRAGAGSGKTAALVELNSRFLNNTTPVGEVSLNQILAITFTEKAAGELKERIRHMIEENLVQEGADEEKWLTERQNLLHANISTFHSFCTRVLREHPLQAGVDPYFEMLDSAKAEDILRRCADAVLYEALKDRRNEIGELVLLFGWKQLQNTFVNTVTALRNSGQSTETLPEKLDFQHTCCRKETEKEKLRLTALAKALFEVCETLLETKKSKVPQYLENYRAFRNRFPLPELKRRIGALGNGNAEEELGLLGELCGLVRGRLPADLSEIKEDLKDCAGKILPAAIRFFLTEDRQRCVIELIRETERRYGMEKRTFLDFEDLLVKTRDLLKTQPAIRHRYKKAFKVLLVDEFQDTNEIQREIVYLLAECLNKASKDYSRPEELELESRKLFIVGDAKQSIYQFRGADVSVFGRVIEDIKKKGGREIVFRDNFRTLSPIIRMLNPFFARTMQSDSDPYAVGFGPDDHLQPYRNPPELSGARVELLLTQQEKKARKRRKTEAAAVAARIHALAGSLDITDGEGLPCKAGFRDMAVLMRTTTHLPLYTKALREAGIPYVLVKGRGFYESQEIRDMVSLLSFLAGMERDLNLTAIMRSALADLRDNSVMSLKKQYDARRRKENFPGGFADFVLENKGELSDENEDFKRKRMTAALKELSGKVHQLIPAELLNAAQLRFNLFALLEGTFQGAQKIANIKKLIEKARSLPPGENSLENFLRFLERETEKGSAEAEAQIPEQNDNSVKIMTIHQSKGLEFPVVIIPELDGRPGRRSEHNIYTSADRGIALRYRNERTQAGEDTWLSLKIREEQDRREKAEFLRVLYVALTRARDYLILSACTGEEKPETEREVSTWQDMLFDFLGSEKIAGFLNSGEKERELSYESETATSSPAFSVKLVRGPAPGEKNAAHQRPPGCSLMENTENGNTGDGGKWRRILAGIGPPAGRGAFTVVMSPSDLTTFSLCRKKFLYDNLTSGKEGIYGRSELPPEGYAQMFGWTVHKLLESLDFGSPDVRSAVPLQAIRLKKGKLVPEAAVDRAEKAVHQILESESIGRTGLLSAKNYLKDYDIYYSCRRGGSDVYMYGLVDLLLENEEGRPVIIDYKYGEESDLYDDQISACALGLHRLGFSPLAYIIFLDRSGARPRPADTSEQAMKRTEEKILLAAESLEELQDFRRELSVIERKTCRHIGCPYQERCHGENENPLLF